MKDIHDKTPDGKNRASGAVSPDPRELALLSYCRFTKPGTYTVTAYQAVEFGVPVKEFSDKYDFSRSLGGIFEIEIVKPDPAKAVAMLEAAKRARTQMVVPGPISLINFILHHYVSCWHANNRKRTWPELWLESVRSRRPKPRKR